MADPASGLDRHPGLQRSGGHRRGRRVARRRRRRGTRSSSSTTGRRTTPARARAAGRRHGRAPPLQQGNGAAVKSGIRRATGEYVLIVDGDGQHQGRGRACGSWRGSASTTSSSARGRRATQATQARRFGNAALNWLASYLTGREIPDLTSGFRGARREYLREFLHLLPNGFSTPTTTTLAFIKAGYNVDVRADRGAAARRHLEDPARARRREVPDDHPQDRHALQPAARVPADQPRVVRARRRLRRLDDRHADRTSPTRRSC